MAGINFKAFDLGGHEIARRVWKDYYAKVSSFVKEGGRRLRVCGQQAGQGRAACCHSCCCAAAGAPLRAACCRSACSAHAKASSWWTSRVVCGGGGARPTLLTH